jgi:hypothetical protein
MGSDANDSILLLLTKARMRHSAPCSILTKENEKKKERREKKEKKRKQNDLCPRNDNMYKIPV